MRKDRKLDDLGEKTNSEELRGGEYIKTCEAQRRDPACVFKRLRLASEALMLHCWFPCPATELVLNIYYAPTADTLRLRHALEIFQHIEPSRNLSVVLRQYWRPEIMV